MIESATLDRLLTQVNCRITSIARLRNAGAISERKAWKRSSNRQLNFARNSCGRLTVKISPLSLKRPWGQSADRRRYQ